MTFIMYIPQVGILICFLSTSNVLGYCKENCENVIRLNSSLKSEVFLPCYFDTDFGENTASKAETVRWSHFSSLLKITQNGNIAFDNPRGRTSDGFPILAAGGNFSILINDLQTSDLGTYCCELNRECRRVEITESAYSADKTYVLNPWIYFAAGAGLFILLFIAFYLFSRFCEHWLTRSSKSNSDNGLQREGNHTEQTQNTESSEQRNRKKREIEVHTVNQVTGMQQRQNPQRAFRAVPEPTTSQQSNSKPYYVNQAELFILNNADRK